MANIDSAVFNLITITLKNGFFDVIMPILSDAKLWRIPLVLIMLCFVGFGRQKGMKTVLLCLLAVGLSDLICGNILQPLINRPRPLGGVTPSFPSCHASNLFAAATVIFLIWRKAWVAAVVFGISLLVGYSRIYTTSHYPSDVLAGMVLGVGYAFLVQYIYKLTVKKIERNKRFKGWSPYL
ncbi:MAG: phosphatase PAP2 family protein [Endomicrobiales bacterium]|nr:phosphatase PAP2 family protein [Endomicrobiales bacterium]